MSGATGAGRRHGPASRRPGRVRRARPLRVGIVLEGMALGGCPINAIDLARTLRDRGHHVVLVAPDEVVPVSVLPYAEAAGFQVERIPTGCGLVGRSRHLRRLSREHELDVLHVFATWLATSAVLACGWSGRCVPVTLNWLMENDFRTTSRIPLIVGTRSLHREALERHGARSYLLEPPVDVERDRPDAAARLAFRARLGIAEDDLVLVLVGRIDALTEEQQVDPDHRYADKLPGIMLVLDAVRQRRDPRLRLVLVGDGSGMGLVRRRVDEVNQALGREAVVLTGALDDPHPAYAAADIGLAMGGSALRVMAHGTPLIVLGDRGFSRVFSPDTAEYFFEEGYYGVEAPEDPVGTFLGHIDLLAEPDVRTRMGAWALDVVRSRYALQAGATFLEQLYREAVDHTDSRWERAHDIAYAGGRDAAGRLRRRLAPAWGTT